jgi:hypothetical protein
MAVTDEVMRVEYRTQKIIAVASFAIVIAVSIAGIYVIANEKIDRYPDKFMLDLNTAKNGSFTVDADREIVVIERFFGDVKAYGETWSYVMDEVPDWLEKSTGTGWKQVYRPTGDHVLNWSKIYERWSGDEVVKTTVINYTVNLHFEDVPISSPGGE